MSSDKIFTDAELRYWRLSAAVQELCHATDADIEADNELKRFISLTAIAFRTYQDTVAKKKEIALRTGILEQVGIPVIKPKKK